MPNNMVDVMGIVDRVEPSAIIQTRDSREVSPSARPILDCIYYHCF